MKGKRFFDFIKIILIISPIIIFCIDFCATFWGVNYELNVDQTNSFYYICWKKKLVDNKK